jgi:transcription initiation factor TFIIB
MDAWDILRDMLANPSPTANTAVQACCSSARHVLDEGLYVCCGCGTVAGRFIDPRPEWRSAAACAEDGGRACQDTARCGLPVDDLLPDASMSSTTVGFVPWGRACRETLDMRMVRRYHVWNGMTYKERCLLSAFDALTVRASNSGINRIIINEAKVLYKRMYEGMASRGESRAGMVATSVFMACKHNGVPRSAKEIALMFDVKLSTVTRGCKRYHEMVAGSDVVEAADGECVVPATPEDFVRRFASRMRMDAHHRDLCAAVARALDDVDAVLTSMPPSIAAAIVAICSEFRGKAVDKKELAAVTQVSIVTINKCIKRIQPHMERVLGAMA